MSATTSASATAEDRPEAPATAGLRLREIPSLDGMRMVAVSLVFIAHAGLEKWVPGGFGVTLFFFLSGYLITTLMRIEYEKHGRVSISNFYMRRFLRIFPPLYITVTIALLLGVFAILPSSMTPMGVASNYLFFSNYQAIFADASGAPGMGPLWSLAVEEHFYLLFPFVFSFWLVRYPPKRRALALFIFCGIVLLHRMYIVFILNNYTWPYSMTDTRLDSIAFGCILALWGNPMLDPEVRERPHTMRWFWVGIAALVLCLVIRSNEFRETFRYSIQGLALMLVFTAVILFPTFPLFRWLNGWVAKWIAAFSYTIYLFHYVAFSLVETYVSDSPIPRALLSGILVIAYAWVIYLLVEKPVAKLRKRYA